jgi:F0F1-type ATP synthase membrane subunit c/vacuolar-type H+-ATPase subunit K
MKLAIIVMCCFVSACSSDSSLNPAKAARDLDLVKSGRSSGIVDDESLQKEQLEVLFSPSVGQAASPAYRNQVQSRLLAKSDINCNQFIEAVDTRRAANNVSLGFFATATATAAAIVAGRAGQNLAGVSAVTSATQQSINDEMFAGILMPNIVKEIRTSRSVLRDAISLKFGEPVSSYSYYTAVSDVIYYHNLCSLTVALSSIVSKATALEARKTVSTTEMLAALDAEILTTRNAILSSDLGLTEAQKKQLREDLVRQYQRRSELVKTFALPSRSESSSEQGEGNGRLPSADESKTDLPPAGGTGNGPVEKKSPDGTAVTGKAGASGGAVPEKSLPRPSGAAAAGAELLLK